MSTHVAPPHRGGHRPDRGRPPGGPSTLRARATLGGLFLAVLACAHQVAPTGGPLDESPPQVASTSPALFATDVSPDSPLEIVFSERVNRDRAEDALVVRPHVDWAGTHWRGDTLVFVPRGGWAEGTTYVALIRTTVVDRRRNALAEPALVVFATGPVVATGQVSGTIQRIGISAGLTTVLAFAEPVADTANVDVEQAISVTEPDAQGRFILPGLELGHGYEVGAYFDVGGDRAFDPERDLYCRVLHSVVPDSGGGPSELTVVLVFPDEPGRIEGVVVDSTCQELASHRARRFARMDSTFAARDSLLALRGTLRARVDSLLGEAIVPTTGSEDALPDLASPESLRSRADSLRAVLEGLVIPDSAEVATEGRLSPEERADSLYCAAPVRFRFAAMGDTTEVANQATADGAYRTPAIPPGTYTGAVWRDLRANDAYDRGTEPGSPDSLRVYVPPGRSGVLDTLWIGRPALWVPEPRDTTGEETR